MKLPLFTKYFIVPNREEKFTVLFREILSLLFKIR